MTSHRLRIELLSDMCCGSGEGNGVEQDITSGYDEAGLPVIYGKRLKGLLRDKAEFMAAYGYEGVTGALIDRVFGTGTMAGTLKVGNAEIEHAREIREEILCHEERDIVNPGSVERVFTVNRYSTEIGVNGVAKDNSLRMIGAVPKGNVFYADLDLETNNENGEEEKLLENAVKLLRGIGLSRNRGLGEVRCSLEEKEERKRFEPFSVDSEANVLHYVLNLDAAVVSGTDYIAGAAMQGWFMSRLPEEEVKDFLFRVKFSNAYIHKDGKRYLPMPFGMLKIKNRDDKAYSTADGVELREDEIYMKQRKYCFLSGDRISEQSVEHGLEFHFAKKDKNIFSISSISAGQSFQGSIYGEPAYLKKIFTLINKNEGIVRMGASATAQYAKAGFVSVTGEKIKKETLSVNEDEWLVVEFLSDVILVDEMGINRTEEKLIERELRKILGEDAELSEIYTQVVNVGGYNAKWKLPKRRFSAFSKGSQMTVKGLKGDFELYTHGFIGILQGEGYGEYRIRKNAPAKEYKVEKTEEAKKSVVKETDKAKEIIGKVTAMKAEEYCAYEAKEAVMKLSERPSASTAMRLLSAYKTAENDAVNGRKTFIESYRFYMDENFKGSSNESIMKLAERALEDFLKWKEKRDAVDCVMEKIKEKEDRMFKVFLENYILYLKLRYRGEE